MALLDKLCTLHLRLLGVQREGFSNFCCTARTLRSAAHVDRRLNSDCTRRLQMVRGACNGGVDLRSCRQRAWRGMRKWAAMTLVLVMLPPSRSYGAGQQESQASSNEAGSTFSLQGHSSSNVSCCQATSRHQELM